MFHPFFNIHEMSDDALLEKHNELYNRLAHCEFHGQTQAAYEIRIMIDQIQMERSNRLQKSRNEYYEKNNPDHMKPIELGEIKNDDK